MPLKVTFELSDRDLRYFRQTMTQVAKRSAKLKESDLIKHAAEVVRSLPEDTPEFVRERAEKLSAMVDMLNDEEWRLEGKDRERMLKAISYFADPEDLIPDTIPGIGFLDDAIMIELVVRELRPELDAYDDFCKFRDQKDKLLKKGAQDATFRGEWLEARRTQLQSRMRRRRRRGRGSAQGKTNRSPLSLW